MNSDLYKNSSAGLTGTPSDEVPAILATGRSDVGSLFVSMSERHPDGSDADYLRWHSLDHRPEQLRLSAIRNSLRVVSTPRCRQARAACDESFAAVDHVMTYFFTDTGGLDSFVELSDALREAGRSPFILPPVQRGVYNVQERASAPRMKVGCDVLPWFPVMGAYILLEEGDAPSSVELAAAPGVAGIWSATSVPSATSSAGAEQRLTFCFLDCDPVDTAEALKPLLRQRWQDSGARPLFAAPFYAIVPYVWDRYLP